MNPDALLYFAAWLFCVGMCLVIIKRNTLLMLVGTELMLNAANVNLVYFNSPSGRTDGSMFALFVIVIAVCEAAVGLAIMMRVYHFYQTSVPDQINELKEKN